jgi:hypothetical protein
MSIIHDYEWLNQYLANDRLWLEDSSNWESSLAGYKSSISPLATILGPFYRDLFIFFDSFNKLSFVDTLFTRLFSNNYAALNILEAFLTDLRTTFAFKDLKLSLFYQSDFQNLLTSVSLNAPELLLALTTFVATSSALLNSVVAQVYPYMVQAYSLETTTPANLLILLCTVWVVLLLTSSQMRNSTLDKTADTYWAKFVLYLYSIIKDNRIQLESAIIAFNLFVLYYAILLIGFSDILNYSSTHLSTFLVVVFVASYLTFLFKNAVHYFSFLEATVADKSLMGYVVQFLKDSSNSIAIILRFLTLLVRLNLYDLVDDILDSNYIFFCDFEEERFLSDSLSSFSKNSQFIDTLNYKTHDRIYSSYPTLLLNVDLYALFFVLWGKVFFFLFFAFEEIGRVFLAFFIIYLVLFEMQTLNRSYVESKNVL